MFFKLYDRGRDRYREREGGEKERQRFIYRENTIEMKKRLKIFLKKTREVVKK